MLEVSGHTCDQTPICGAIYSNSQVSSVVDEEIAIESPKVSQDFPSLPSDRSISDCSHESLKSHKSPIKATTQTYSTVVKSSLPQSIIKSFVTLHPIHHELPIENFEVSQCSQNPESSSLDESSPRFQKQS